MVVRFPAWGIFIPFEESRQTLRTAQSPFNCYPAPSTASLYRQSLCLNIFVRATPVCLRWTPDVAINWLPSAGTFRIKTGPEAGYRYWTFSVFLRHTGRITGQYLELVHSRFVPHPLQFISHNSSDISTLYSLNYRRRRYKTIILRTTFRQLALIPSKGDDYTSLYADLVLKLLLYYSTRWAMYVQRNNKARSCNRCCSGKTVTLWDSTYAATTTTTTTTIIITRILMLFTARLLHDILLESNQIQWSSSLHTLFGLPYVQNVAALTKPSLRRYCSRPHIHPIFDIVAYTAIVYLYYWSAFIYKYVVILIFVTGCILKAQQYIQFSLLLKTKF